MTLPASYPYEHYVYTGPGEYPFNFYALQPYHIRVVAIRRTGEEEELTYLSDFEVTLEGQTGGKVNLFTDDENIVNLKIFRATPYEQPYDWVNQGPMDMELLEDNFDYLAMQIQQLAVAIGQGMLTNWRGEWASGVNYHTRDLVLNADTIYFCLNDHLSGIFENDLKAGYWNIVLEMVDVGDIDDLVRRAEEAARLSELWAQESENFASLAEDAQQQAAQHAQHAGDSANAASLSAQQASLSAGRAYQWAEHPEDSEVQPGEYSAYHWAQKAATFDPDSYFHRSEFITVSTGSGDAGKPILLNASGLVDSSMLDVTGGFYYVGPFTPTSGAEYPDTTGENPGAFWTIEGVDESLGYEFQGGDLAGETVYIGDMLILGSASWAIIRGSGADPSAYYKLDGSQPLEAPFAAGGQQLKNVAPGTDSNDVVIVSQIADFSNQFYAVDGSNPLTAPLAGGGHQIKDIIDGTDTTDAVTLAQLNTKETVHDAVRTAAESPYGILIKMTSLTNPDDTGSMIFIRIENRVYFKPYFPGVTYLELYFTGGAWYNMKGSQMGPEFSASAFWSNADNCWCIYLSYESAFHDVQSFYVSAYHSNGYRIPIEVSEAEKPTDIVYDQAFDIKRAALSDSSVKSASGKYPSKISGFWDRDSEDINSKIEPGFYGANGTNQPNNPFGYGGFITMPSGGDRETQLGINESDERIYWRVIKSDVPESWHSISDEDVQKIDPFTLSAGGRTQIVDNLDANTLANYSWVLADDNPVNTPGNTEYWYLLTVPSADNVAMQLAVRRAGALLMAYRHNNSGTWTEWEIVPRMRYDSADGTLYIRDDGSAP